LIRHGRRRQGQRRSNQQYDANIFHGSLVFPFWGCRADKALGRLIGVQSQCQKTQIAAVPGLVQRRIAT
jgi:hypothetical protein